MPDTKLSLPKFSIQGKTETRDGDPDGNRFAILSPEVRNALRRRMAEKEQRRRKLNAGALSILVDGVHGADLELEPGKLRSTQVELQEGANLIEIQAQDEYGSLLAATQLVPYVDNSFGFSKTTAIVSKGKLTLSIVPIVNSADGRRRALLTINYSPNFNAVRFWMIWPLMRISWRSGWSYAVAALTIAFVMWGLTSTYYKHRIALLQQSSQKAPEAQNKLLPIQTSAAAHYLLLSDDQRVRSQEHNGIPTISLRSQPQVIVLDLELSATIQLGTFSADLQTFSGDRILMTQNYLAAKTVDKKLAVPIIVPAELLQAGGYYTVQLYSAGPTGRSELINRFTFKVTSHE